MASRRMWMTLAIGALAASAGWAQMADTLTTTLDLERAEFQADVQAMRAELAEKAAPVPPGGIDTDSFGRNVKFLGLTQAGVVSFTDDCTPLPGDPPPGPDDRCVTLNPAPAVTNYNFPDIGRLTIPGKSANSLLCHWLSPVAFYAFQNLTGVSQPNALFRLIPYVVIESAVLADPALINPLTGLPFNGSLETGFSATYQDGQSLDPGQRALRRWSDTRACINGFLSKRMLKDTFGLSDALANQVFKQDLTLRFGLRGSAAMVAGGSVIYGLRVVGD